VSRTEMSCPASRDAALAPDGRNRMDPSDSELIKACLAGDQQAWNEFVTRYARLVYSIARRRGLDADAAADVFQEVFLIVHRQLYSLQHHQALVAWLITITQRECRRLVQRSHPTDPLDDTYTDERVDISAQVQRWEMRQTIDRAMRELEPRCRELLTALFLEETPPDYIQLSQRLGIPMGSIGPIRARCLKTFEAILRKLGV
jgi:RNA polymerase sigma factor (sigma-70 family)